MKHRITRKITLGMLLALVLALGVQGTADALTFGTSRSGDLQTVQVGDDFTIRFSVSLKGNTSIRNAQNQLVDEDNTRIDSSGYQLDANGNRVDPAVKSTGPKRYHYNEEKISITADNAMITHVGSYDIDDVANDTAYELLETGKDGKKLTSSVTLRLNTSTANTVTITIADRTPGNDIPGGESNQAPSIKFTVYVVKEQLTVSAGTTSFGSEKDGVEFAADRDILINAVDNGPTSYFTFSADDAPVYYSVEGSGRVYIKESASRRTTNTSTLRTSSEAPVYLDPNNGTSKVTVYIAGTTSVQTAIFIFQGPTIDKYPEIEITQGNNQTGATEARLEQSLKVRVTDGNNRPISGVAVEFSSTYPSEASETNSQNPAASMFIPVPGTIVYGSGSTLTQSLTSGDTTLAFVNNTTDTMTATSLKPGAGEKIYVQTDRSGEAEVYFQLSSRTGAHAVTATLQGQTNLTTLPKFSVDAVEAGRSASLVIVSGNNQRSDATTHDVRDPLLVRVRRPGGYRIADVRIRFTVLTGVLEPARGRSAVLGPGQSAPITTSGQEIFINTDAHGEAGVTYNVGQIAGAKTVTARVDDEEATSQYDFQIRQVVFNINGTGSTTQPTTPTTPTTPTPTTPTTVSVPSSISGTAGGTATLTVTAPATARVTAGGFNDTFPLGSASSFTRSGTTYTSTLTLPSTAGTYTLTVFAGTEQRTVSVSVTAATPQTGALSISVPLSGAPGAQQQATVTATDADGNAASGVAVTLAVTNGGGAFSPASVTTGTNGTATSTLTRGATAGTNYFVTANATNYTEVRTRITITGATTPTPTTPAGTAGTPVYLDLYDGDNQRGSLNTPLSERLAVEVLDANEDPVDDVRVRFRVSVGSGTFQPRTPRTDEDGFAEVRFTPTSSGRIVVIATVTGIDDPVAFSITAGEAPETLSKVSGDVQNGTPGRALANPFVVEARDEAGDPVEGVRVTFSVTAGGGRLSETSGTTNKNGRAQTTLTLGSTRGVNSVRASVQGVDPVTFSTSVEPKILVSAANRPAMVWIDSGMLYGLTGAKTTKIAESVNGAAIGNGKVYWTARTGPSAGTVNSANLDGSGATVLARIRAVPMGIGVSGDKLYWTNSRGRVQSANLNGSGIQNMVENHSGARDVVVHGGFVYWTQGGTAIHRVNITGRKVVQDVAVSLSNVGGIAVGGNKVYWTEATGESAGTINGANLDGTQFKTLATIQAVPMGIAVDTAGSKLYWTNSRGRVQRANLNGSKIQNVVDGLISPSTVVIGGANTATATRPATQPTTQPPKKDTATYDVNGDGNVDNVDASLVSGAMGTNNATYDVNDDGTVNFLDLLLVFDNRDEGAAAAPTILGVKLTAVQIDVIKEQIDLLIATGDRSPAAMRTLVYLQQLIVMARPEKTQLLANYPNPFNPETWIPYELATDTEVRITIYNAQGVVVRSLTLGHQSAGYYTDRERAAYWDGRNSLGEQVASGVYFYQLETDEISSLRKMVILK